MKSVRPVPQPTSRIPSPNSSVSPAQLSPFGPHPQRQIANHSIQQTSTQSGSTTQLYPVRHLSLTPLARTQHADTLELQTLLHSVYSECVFPASSLLHCHPSLTTAFTLKDRKETTGSRQKGSPYLQSLLKTARQRKEQRTQRRQHRQKRLHWQRQAE